MRLEPAAPRSRVKHSTTEPLRSLLALLTCHNIPSLSRLIYLSRIPLSGLMSVLEKEDSENNVIAKITTTRILTHKSICL